jgi:segregation and condensation protein B
MSRRKKEAAAEPALESEALAASDAGDASEARAAGDTDEAQTATDAIAEIPVDDAPIVAIGESDSAGIIEAEGASANANEDETESDGETGGLWPVDRLKPVVEAVIFAAADPTTVRRLRDVVDGATAAEIKAALLALQEDYAARGVRLAEVAGGWQMRSAPEHQEVVKRLFKEKPFRLTRAGMETLAVIAYRQPATRAEVEAIRGVDASAVLESLVERRLVRIAGRRDVPGRPLVYVTTQEFLETFGLKDLKSLPTLPELGEDFRAMAEQSAFTEGDDRNAAILPLEEGEATSGHEERTARTVERADQADRQREEDEQSADRAPAHEQGEAEA